MVIFYCKILLITIIVFCSLYFFLPEIFLHLWGIGVWKRQYSPGVSITFDDGPDPIYTIKLLDILEKHDLKACFFLVGEKVEKHPDIVRKIIEKGHQIGSHGYLHRHAWLFTPKKTWHYWNKSLSVLKRITGTEPDIIRPPWGGVNLALVIWCLVNRKKIVTWNIKSFDWKANQTPANIVNSVIKKTTEGGIILLHDSGGEEGAPANTILCLEDLIVKIKKDLKLPIVPLEFPDWPLPKRVIYHVWQKWEYFYAKINNIRCIDDRNLFRLSLVHYKGPDLIDELGQTVATKGDLIGEIHLYNSRFHKIGTNPENIGINLLKRIRLSLLDLAKYIAHHPDFKNVKVYLGTTILSKGAKKLGFSVQEYPFKNGKLIGIWQKLILKIYHPLGFKRKKAKFSYKPKLIWITKKQLIEKYYTKTKKTN